MHNNDIAHRDLKPQNLLLDVEYNLKITEFGFSCRATSGLHSTYIPGTRHFMAPEIWKGAYNAHEADLFACGIILFFMRTGSCPFYDATDRNSLYKKIISGDTDAFWGSHEKKYPPGYFSAEFKDLLNFMFQPEPTMRLNMAEI